MAFRVDVSGDEKAIAYLKSLRSGAEAAGKTQVLIGSNLRYAYGIEHGRHRRGGLARRAGGAFMLRNAKQAIERRIGPGIAGVLDKGASAVVDRMRALGFDLQRLAQAETPVDTGTLRRSLHTRVGQR